MAPGPKARNKKDRKRIVIKLRSSHFALSALAIFNWSYLGRWPRLLHCAPLALIAVLASTTTSNAQPARASAPATIQTSSFDKEVTDFFTQEMTAHLNEIKSYDPAPDKIFGAGTTGEYTWGSFMNSVGAFAAMTDRSKLGDRDLAREVGQVGLLEYRLKSTRFSQLYGVLALRYFGKNLDTNPVWQSLNEEQRAQWRRF